MNDDSLNQLFAKAREAGPHDTSRVEFGFETRLTARLDARQAFVVWPWRLLPFFAVVAICLVWTTWRTSADRDLAIRSSLESGAVEWDFVEGLTGKTL